jgi:hypothetical protein
MQRKETVTLALTSEEAKRIRKLGRELWPEEDLGLSEVCRRLLLAGADQIAVEYKNGKARRLLEEAC